ncbi:MAG: shikimate kinase [Clostridiales bacterium]|nr:shikimate kinase [Clostridiales bacterium]
MNIVLIGMPGCGKSTVGVVLAKALGMDFIDTDLLIQRSRNMRLHQIIDQVGDEGFRTIENEVNASLNVDGCVIATGGSVVYGQEAMEHLRGIGTVVYLRLEYAQVRERLGDLHARGVSMRPGQTLHDLFDERTPLYEKWAHITIHCDGLRLREVVANIRSKLDLA